VEVVGQPRRLEQGKPVLFRGGPWLRAAPALPSSTPLLDGRTGRYGPPLPHFPARPELMPEVDDIVTRPPALELGADDVWVTPVAVLSDGDVITGNALDLVRPVAH
jgi:hypothetical protein